MGEDKCFLNYHGQPQCYHVYEMLQPFCHQVFISCNTNQLPLINNRFNTLADIDKFHHKGPATGLLTAFNTYPGNNFLVIACDYPLLSSEEIRHFVENIPAGAVAAAFYDDQEQAYQPVLGFYAAEAGHLLNSSPEILSLKRLLESVNAYKHSALDPSSLKGADTKDAAENIMQLTNHHH